MLVMLSGYLNFQCNLLLTEINLKHWSLLSFQIQIKHGRLLRFIPVKKGTFCNPCILCKFLIPHQHFSTHNNQQVETLLHTFFMFKTPIKFIPYQNSPHIF